MTAANRAGGAHPPSPNVKLQTTSVYGMTRTAIWMCSDHQRREVVSRIPGRTKRKIGKFGITPMPGSITVPTSPGSGFL